MQRRLDATLLPQAPLDAAATFHSQLLEDARKLSTGDTENLVVMFAPCNGDSRGWRRSALADLAREAAPCRVNGIEGGDAEAQGKALHYLDNAPAVTGQYLPLDEAP